MHDDTECNLNWTEWAKYSLGLSKISMHELDSWSSLQPANYVDS